MATQHDHDLAVRTEIARLLGWEDLHTRIIYSEDLGAEYKELFGDAGGGPCPVPNWPYDPGLSLLLCASVAEERGGSFGVVRRGGRWTAVFQGNKTLKASDEFFPSQALTSLALALLRERLPCGEVFPGEDGEV